MVDLNISVEHLKPELWIHFKEVLDMYCPKLNILHVLKDSGKFRAVTQSGENVELKGIDFTHLENIWEYFSEIDEIRIYTIEGLEKYERKIQDISIYDWDIDEYLEYQYKMLEETEGIQVFQKKEMPHHIFQPLKKWIREDGIYLLWITNKGNLFFNCILVVQGQKIKVLTTSGRYADDWDDIEKVKADIGKEFPHLTCHVIIRDS